MSSTVGHSSLPRSNTLDDISSDVFDRSNSFFDSPRHRCVSELYGISISRSVGDLHQMDEDVKKHYQQKKTRNRSSSMMSFDVSAPLLEHVHENVAKWQQNTANSPELQRMLFSTYSPTHSQGSSETSPRAKIPLSPTCYRVYRKQCNQNIVHQKPLSATPSIVKQNKSLQNLRQSPLHHRAQSIRTGSSPRLDTSEENSNSGAQHTLDSYSNSVFLDDDDPTIFDHEQSSGFTDTEDEGDYPRPFHSSPLTPPRSLMPKKERLSPTGDKETRTANPLFRSARAQHFIDHNKQSWQVPPTPEENIVRHTNPLYQNRAINDLIRQNRVPWEVPGESPKPRRSFFKKPSLTDISAFMKADRAI